MVIFHSYATNYQRVPQPATVSPVSRRDADPRAATIREVCVGVVKARAAVRRPGAQRIIVHHARGQIGVLINRRRVEVIKTCVAFWEKRLWYIGGLVKSKSGSSLSFTIFLMASCQLAGFSFVKTM
jgi:hypothetical protein